MTKNDYRCLKMRNNSRYKLLKNIYITFVNL